MRQGSSRRPAQTQTPARSGAGVRTHTASENEAEVVVEDTLLVHQNVCQPVQFITTQGPSEPVLVAEGKEAMHD